MLMRYDPFRDFDRLAERLRDEPARGTPRSFPMDAFRRGDEFTVRFDLPGVDSKSIDLTVDQNVLTVTAERQAEFREDDQVIAAERPQGTYTRQVLLGNMLDSERIGADYENGVLTLTLPVAEQAKPRKIEIGGGSDRRTIETQSLPTD